MRPHTGILMAAVLVAASSAALAGVVRNRTGNSGVTTGGQPTQPHFVAPVPYSLIGSLTEAAGWPCRWTVFSFPHRGKHRPSY